MTYIEAPPSIGGNGGSTCYHPKNKLANAQNLSTIANGTYDFVIAAHVLEHMRDVLGAVANWLRVVRRGGTVIFMLPDPCDPTWENGERMRLATAPEHFMTEFGNEGRQKAHDMEHLREGFLMVYGMGKQHAGKRDHRLMEKNFTANMEQAARNDRAVMENAYRRTGIRLSQRHVHVWSWFTLQRMLQLAEPAFAKQGVPFRVAEQYTTRRRDEDAMKEFRVVLQRLP